ncbi:MAG: PhnD/SsuA/transferrin family substrate-binding protein [Halothiobacillaceae bacterium]|nr:PhnD/SsuA/transferrin family substrate-binding protein [Halothiobacillaceae bacterium]
MPVKSRFLKHRLQNTAILSLLFFQGPAQAELYLCGLPLAEGNPVIEENYKKVAQHLSTLMHETVTYAAPKNMREYSEKIRGGNYDLVMDGSHLAAWRIANLQHQPVAQTNETLQFRVVSRADIPQINSIKDLINRPVCVQPIPVLATLELLELYPNPINQPVLKYVASNVPAPYKGLVNGECDAIILPEAYYQGALDDKQREQLRSLHKTPERTGLVLTASPRIYSQQLEALKNHLIHPGTEDAPLLQALGETIARGKAEQVQWSEVDIKQLRGLEKLLPQYSLEWRVQK